MLKVCKVFFALCFLSACASEGGNRFVYDGMQSNQKEKCYELPDSQVQDCLDSAAKSYDEYKREREEELSRD